MNFFNAVGEALAEAIKWIAIVAGSLLIPSISVWAIIKLVKWIIRILTTKE